MSRDGRSAASLRTKCLKRIFGLGADFNRRCTVFPHHLRHASKLPARLRQRVSQSHPERKLQRQPHTMLECPRCFCDQVYRASRTGLERLLFAQAFECRMCGYRERVGRAGVRVVFGLIPWLRPRLKTKTVVSDSSR